MALSRFQITPSVRTGQPLLARLNPHFRAGRRTRTCDQCIFGSKFRDGSLFRRGGPAWAYVLVCGSAKSERSRTGTIKGARLHLLSPALSSSAFRRISIACAL